MISFHRPAIRAYWSRSVSRWVPVYLAVLLVVSCLISSPVAAQAPGLTTAQDKPGDVATTGPDRSPKSLGPPTVMIALEPMKDNTLYEDAGGALSNGAGFFLFAGQSNLGLRRRGLVAFDVAGSLPASATIVTAELRLEMNRSVAGTLSVRLHRVLADWGQSTSDADGQEGMGDGSATGDATWLHTFFNTDTWSTAGGDFEPTASASQSVSGFNLYTWGSTPQMVADVQAWLSTPSSNFGWMILGDESTSRTVKRFSSSENPAPSTRPVLTITYSSDETIFVDGFETGDTSVWAGQVP